VQPVCFPKTPGAKTKSNKEDEECNNSGCLKHDADILSRSGLLAQIGLKCHENWVTVCADRPTCGARQWQALLLRRKANPRIFKPLEFGRVSVTRPRSARITDHD
jgi:hypothetical protein